MSNNELEAENKKLKRKIKVLEQTMNQFSTIKSNYDLLIHKLEEKEQNLKDINLKLEDLVKERTSELESINAKLQENLVLLEKLSTTDALTGLLNRHSFNEVVSREFRRAKRQGYEFNFLIIDVDNFKKYNDCYGHQSGDDVLKVIGDVLNAFSQRSTDYAFRFGGEEFVYVSCFLNEEKTKELAELIRKRIEDKQIPHKFNNENKIVTVSIGAVLIDSTTSAIEDSGEVFSLADKNLYEAKDAGRNCCILSKA